MKKLLIGNAPCSWGTLEFESTKGDQVPFDRMLDELKECGYTGTELGDWGYMPTDPSALRTELAKRGLVMLGAFVPVALKYSTEHRQGTDAALKTARLLKAVAGHPAPYLVLADENGREPIRTQLAGRAPKEAGLLPGEWKTFAAGANRIAQAVWEETGLRTVFHHHCAGYVETPDEIATLLELTDPRWLGLVFDTGHFFYGSGAKQVEIVSALEQFKDRIWYVHCKDCSPRIADRARQEKWDYFTALRHGVFCELGNGAVDFPGVLRWLGANGYQGYVLVEQDILPGMESPKESAARNLRYLRSIEANFIG